MTLLRLSGQTMRYYVILCHARTGSNLLVNVLAQHPSITSHNELFHEQTVYFADKRAVSEDMIRRRDAAPIDFMEAVLAEAKTLIVGFKHLLFYDESIIDYVMSQPHFQIILLERKNILAQYSSMQIAHQTSQWTLHRGDVPVEATSLAWNAEDFHIYADAYRRAYSDLKQKLVASGSDWLQLHYSDLQDGTAFERVFDFLGVEAIRIDTGVICKQNTSRVVERFSQPQQVRDYLQQHHLMDWETET